jgi:hypothetical protein
MMWIFRAGGAGATPLFCMEKLRSKGIGAMEIAFSVIRQAHNRQKCGISDALAQVCRNARWCVLLVGGVCLMTGAARFATPSPPIVLRFAAYVDRDGRRLPNATIVVDGERMVAVSAGRDRAAGPKGAKTLDLRRYTAVPA